MGNKLKSSLTAAIGLLNAYKFFVIFYSCFFCRLDILDLCPKILFNLFLFVTRIKISIRSLVYDDYKMLLKFDLKKECDNN